MGSIFPAGNACEGGEEASSFSCVLLHLRESGREELEEMRTDVCKEERASVYF